MSNLKIFTDNVEVDAVDQINTLLDQPAFKDCKVRIMPDVHAGKGCVIGFTADLGDKVIPNIVGVDIGCGMMTVNLGNIKLDLEKLDKVIHEFIPSGYDVHDGRIKRFDELKELHCYRDLKGTKRLERAIGSLGGGNHFIEIDRSSYGDYYLIIHTGSRNLGKQVAEYYQNLAIELMRGKEDLIKQKESIIAQYKATGRKKEIQKTLKELDKLFNAKELSIPKELCYLEGKYRDKYLHDMRICQEYANLNRRTICDIILDKMNISKINYFKTIHNYIEHDTNIVRKGAISAKIGELLLIPINMKDGCILGRGKGSEDWNYSAPHGAGRLMSRSKARKILNVSDFKESMNGIFTTCVSEKTIDEAPMAYKSLEDIVDNISDTVDIIDILKPIYNFKAN